jgi:SSS family solute:Na+ symporter
LTLVALVARDLMREGAGRDAWQIFIGRVVVVLVVLLAAAFAVRKAAIVDENGGAKSGHGSAAMLAVRAA